MDENRNTKSSIRNNFLISFIILIVLWGVFSAKIFQHDLHIILMEHNIHETAIQTILRKFTFLSTGATITATIIAICAAIFISMKITKPIKKLIDGVNEIAKGNLVTIIPNTCEDEIGQLTEAINLMASNLEKITISRDKLNAEIKLKKEFEDKLIKSGELFKLLIENLPIGVMIVDMNKKIVNINPEALKLVGCDKSEVIGEFCHKIVCVSDEWNCPILDKKMDLNNFECEIIREDGLKKTILKNVVRIEIDGKSHLLEAFLDIGELKEIEKELISEKNKAQNYLDIAGVIIIALDRDGNVTMINKRGCSIIGCQQEEIVGKNWFDNFIPESMCASLKKYFMNLMESKDDDKFQTGFVYENKILTVGGEERLIKWYNTLVCDENNKIIGTLSSGDDITLSKKLEEDLLKSKKLESVSLLAGGIAHDFNNLLTAIMGNIGLALLDADKINESLFMYLKNAEKASNQAKGLAQQLLTFSRGGMPVKKAVNISELITESVKFCLKGRNIKCEFFFDEDIYAVEADQTQISQVIQNLIINAMQAMPGGGNISIGCKNIVIEPDNIFQLKQGKYVHISVCDNGSGIDEGDLDKIFDPYFTTKVHGSGLGLATCYSIIKKHGGSITAESVFGEGTEFHIYLPASEKFVCCQVKSSTEKDSVSFSAKGRVLIMDDEEIVRQVLGCMLSKIGYVPEFAVNGEQAIEKYKEAYLKSDPFHLVIMDLTIPGGMGGKETVEKLRSFDPCLKAIVSSGYSNDPIMANYKQFGFDGVVPKPIIYNQLCDSLKCLQT